MAPKKEVALSKTGWTTLVHLVLAAWKPQEPIGLGVTTSLLLEDTGFCFPRILNCVLSTCLLESEL